MGYPAKNIRNFLKENKKMTNLNKEQIKEFITS